MYKYLQMITVSLRISKVNKGKKFKTNNRRIYCGKGANDYDSAFGMKNT